MTDRYIPPHVRDQIERGALFVVNHSGGKDSQAMMLKIAALVPADQLLVVHAPLGIVEWKGTIEHIERTIPAGAPIILAPFHDGRTLMDRIEERGMFPGPGPLRWCTSDFKRGPIEREIRRYLKANPRYQGRIINCMGMRAEESTDRAKLETWTFSKRNSKAGRQWFDWLPIHDLAESEVFAAIEAHGQAPHWAYSRGMRRLSCCFCIYATPGDLRTAARLNPDLYRRYVELERRIGHTLSPSCRPLPEVTGIEIDGTQPPPRQMDMFAG